MAITQVTDAQKNFDFFIEIDGINQFAVQTVDMPDVGFDVVEHGNGRRRTKTAGQEITGETTMTKIKPIATTDRWAWDWLTAARYGRARDYKRTFVLKEMDPSGTRAINRWRFDGAWISNFNNGNFDRLGTENLIQTLTIQADEINLL